MRLNIDMLPCGSPVPWALRNSWFSRNERRRTPATWTSTRLCSSKPDHHCTPPVLDLLVFAQETAN
eukprot:386923-Prymnesium_polylepis.1